jgi:hypothetical protein
MQSSPYYDIIENKITEWQLNIKKLEERARKADPGAKGKLENNIEQLKLTVKTATLELRDLDKQEDAVNTLAIKNKILEIFDSIDRNLTIHDKKTPFML